MKRIPRGEGALFQKYAPMTFEEMCPTFNITGLKKILRSRGNRLFLFDGPMGTGKSSAARILSMFVNCEAENAPCTICPSCISIMKGNTFDVIDSEIRGIDEANALVRDAQAFPMALKNKVYIIDETHRATPDAQKKLLKLFEAPPKHTYFVLCTTDPQNLLPMIRNDERCLRFQFKKLGVGPLTQLIKEVAKAEHPDNHEIPAEDAKKLALAADGSPRHALQNLEKYWVGAFDEIKEDEQASDVIRVLAKSLYSGTWADVARFLSSYKGDPNELRMNLSNYIRGMLLRATDSTVSDKYARILDKLSYTVEGPVPDKRNRVTVMLYQAAEEARKR